MSKKILIASLLVCAIMYTIEQYSGVSYLVKTIMKIVLFVGVPILVWKGKLRKPSLTDLKIPLILGVCVFVLMLVVYWLLRDLIDLESIRLELATKGIDLSTFLIVFAYVTFGNSFLEEYFFRGFVYQGMGQNKGANFYSASLFSVYHVGIFLSWFTLPIALLCLFGLFVGGLILNALVKKSGTFLGSWIFHIFADLAIIVIGLRMFGVI